MLRGSLPAAWAIEVQQLLQSVLNGVPFPDLAGSFQTGFRRSNKLFSQSVILATEDEIQLDLGRHILANGLHCLGPLATESMFFKEDSPNSLQQGGLALFVVTSDDGKAIGQIGDFDRINQLAEFLHSDSPDLHD
jgi:hypothetical protein